MTDSELKKAGQGLEIDTLTRERDDLKFTLEQLRSAVMRKDIPASELAHERNQCDIYREETHRWKEACNKLTAERDQIAAQVTRLRAISSKFAYGDCEESHEIKQVLSESPPEALRQLKREWIAAVGGDLVRGNAAKSGCFGVSGRLEFMKTTKQNPILLGQAEEIWPEVREEVQKVLKTEGIWLASDITQPGATVPLASINGEVFSMKIDARLDPERFLNTVKFAGPFHAPPTD